MYSARADRRLRPKLGPDLAPAELLVRIQEHRCGRSREAVQDSRVVNDVLEDVGNHDHVLLCNRPIRVKT